MYKKGQDQNGGEEARRSFPPPVTSHLNSSNSCFSLQGANHDDLRNKVPALNPFAQALPAPRSGETLLNPHSGVFSIEKQEEGERSKISMIKKIQNKVNQLSKKISGKQNKIKLSPKQKWQRKIKQVFSKAKEVKMKPFKTEHQQKMLEICQKEKADYLRKKQIEKSNQLINRNEITHRNTMNPRRQLSPIQELPKIQCFESPQLFPSNVLGCPRSEAQQSSKRKLIKKSKHSIVVEKERKQGFNQDKRRRLDDSQEQNQ